MSENRRIWDAVSTTDPRHTKKVEFGRKFTSIDAHWQIMRATEQFGPVGEGWGYTVEHSVERLPDGLVLAVADVTIWWLGEHEKGLATQMMPQGRPIRSYGPIRATAGLLEPDKSGKPRLDDDAPKKAMTDALTKGLSHLGFSADVFLGLFDDNKYVQRVTREFAAAEIPALPPEDKGLLKNPGDERSTYDIGKQKAAENFVAAAIDQFGHMDGAALSDWYRTPTSPKGKSTNRDAVARLAENFPDLHMRLETAAEEVRLRGPILQ